MLPGVSFSGRCGFLTTPSLLALGGGTVQQTGAIARQLGFKKPLIVTDQFILTCGIGERIQATLREEGYEPSVFSQVLPDPSTDAVDAAVAQLLGDGCDSIIAVGGGSPLDAGKGVGVLATNGGTMRDYMGYHRVPKPPIPLLAIPTTAGTGSEATKVTVITDSVNNEKMMCLDRAFLPVAAIVDFELTLGMPYRLTADTGIDSLTHCLEAYVSRKAHPQTDILALAGMEAISRHLITACNHPQNREAREAMMIGAMLGGMAFSNASVCLVHGMSRPIGAFFHVPHGLSNAMLLPAVTRFSVAGAPERYAQCAAAVGAASPETPPAAACQQLVEWLVALNRELQVPTPKQWGIPREDWEKFRRTMAEQALASGSPANNPIVPTVEEILRLYDEMYE
jgi:alcohol dehydrogenase